MSDLTPTRDDGAGFITPLDGPTLDEKLREGSAAAQQDFEGRQFVPQTVPSEPVQRAQGAASRVMAAATGKQSPVKFGSAVIDKAMTALGTRYQMGGNTYGKIIDCSGLVQQAFLASGINLPRTAAAQQKYTKAVSAKDAKAGDLVFWPIAGAKDRVPGADHVAIYLGNGYIIAASSSAGKVVIQKLWGNYTFGRVNA